MRRWARSVAALLFAAMAYLGLGSTAWAQDYTVSSVTGEWVAPPTNAADFGLLGDDANKLMDRTNGFPAFDISYFGANYTSMRVCTNGYVQFGGQSTTSYSPTSGPLSGTNDGLCFPAWGDGWGGSGALTAKIVSWTDGTAPYRRFIIAWTNWSRCCSYNGTVNYQIQFYETTGRIQFAYNGTWTASGSYYTGIDEPGGSGRFVRPTAGETSGSYTFTTNPSVQGWRFDPKETRFTGKILMDAKVSDSTGYGNSVVRGIPVGGLGVELRNTSNSVLASATTAPDGSFTVAGLALVSSQAGSIWVSTGSYISRVVPTVGGSVYSKQIASGLGFGNNATIPDYVLDDTTDSGAAFRGPAEIAGVIGQAYAWVDARTAKPIPAIDVVYDTSSTEASKYVPAVNPNPAYLRIAGPGSANPDAFDPAIVTRVYARHLVKALTGSAPTANSLDLNTRTDGLAALADGLGVYLDAILYGSTQQVDGVTSSLSNIFDYESPSLSIAKDDEVGGWFAAAMYDLVDGANEVHDTIDGTASGAADRPFAVFDGLTSFSLVGFVYDWDARGYGGVGVATNFIHHGLLSDDAGENDDTQSLATDLGTAGVLRRGLTLNPFNEDWFQIYVPKATNVFTVDMTFARPASDPTMLLEVRTAAGAILASAAWDEEAGIYRARTGAIPAGTIYIRIGHQAGSYVGQYDLQATAPLAAMTVGPFAWTVNRPIVVPLTIDGGIGPFAITVKKPSLLPIGLALDAPGARVFGTPTEPGLTDYTLELTDSGYPAASYTVNLTLRVNSDLKFGAPALNGIASGKVTDLNLGRSGGTDPVTISNVQGTLPEGLTLTPEFHIEGTTDATGGGDLSFTATDAAGASQVVSTRLIACAKHPGTPLAINLGAGDSASGFYFDAIQGTTVTVALGTAKKRVVRDLDAFIVGPDGAVVQGGKVKIGKGKASLKNLPILLTGRYFVVLAGKDVGAETQLVASFKYALPRSVGGAETLDFGDTHDFTFGALQGGTATVKCKTTLGMVMRVVYALRPDGTTYPAGEIGVKEAKGSATFVIPIDQSGTWTIRLGAKPGPVGDLKYTVSLKHPKGVFYTAD